jgi:glycosyltransferase involved in cell wall biosynthesis
MTADSDLAKVNSLSVFFPAYNEEANIENTVTKALSILPGVVHQWEIIVVDDGSSDRTGPIVEAMAREEERIRLITHERNRGYGGALKTGLYNARYELIAFTDADGQFDLAEIDRFLETKEKTGADLVIGYYLKRQVPLYRILGSKLLWEPSVYLLFGLKVRDIDCGFKLIDRKVAEKIDDLESERGPFISSEFLIKAKKAGFKIVEIGVHHYPREGGKATGASLKVIVSGFQDLFRLWRKLR